MYTYLDAAIDHGATVSVVLPALNEEATVGDVVRQVLTYPRFHEVIVVDANSTDRTAEVARAAGATVVTQSDIRRDIPCLRGKGDTMWRGINVATGDITVFMDSDLQGDVSTWAPLLAQEALRSGAALTKGFYTRAHGSDPNGGGRATEIMARPLLNAFWTETANLRQPLGGEYALRRDFARAVTFPANYAVEVSLVIDAIERGESIAQVDLGSKTHESQSTLDLGKMSFQIMHEIMRRLDVPEVGRILTQYRDGVPAAYEMGAYAALPAIEPHQLESVAV